VTIGIHGLLRESMRKVIAATPRYADALRPGSPPLIENLYSAEPGEFPAAYLFNIDERTARNRDFGNLLTSTAVLDMTLIHSGESDDEVFTAAGQLISHVERASTAINPFPYGGQFLEGRCEYVYASRFVYQEANELTKHDIQIVLLEFTIEYNRQEGTNP